MAAESEHFTQAEKNEQISTFLSANRTVGNRYSQREVVMMFYSALHYVDAVLATKGIHPTSHISRNGHVATNSDLKTISTKYTNLYHRSRDARYRLKTFDNLAVNNMSTNIFEPIKTHACAFLGKP